MTAPFDVIDIRVRPPSRTFTNLKIFPPPGTPESPYFKWHSSLPPSVGQRNMGLFMEELDTARVGHAVIWGRRVTNHPEVSTKNDDIAAIIDEWPGRFSGFGGVSLPDDGNVASAVALVDDALLHQKFRGITLEPGMSDPPAFADDRRLYPVYERCEELGGILAMTMSRSRARHGNIVFASAEGVDSVARDFPNMKILVSHAFWPWPEVGIGVAYRRKNVYLIPDMYGAGMPGYELWVEAANSFMGNRLLFGSAYPLLGVGEMVASYQRLGFEPDVLERVMGKNAAALLGL